MPSTGITLTDVRAEAMEAIKLLKAGKIDVKTASEVRNLLNTVTDTAKVQVEYLKALPNTVKEKLTVDEVKAIAGTLIDRDAELDLSLKEIEDNSKRTYALTSKP